MQWAPPGRAGPRVRRAGPPPRLRQTNSNGCHHLATSDPAGARGAFTVTTSGHVEESTDRGPDKSIAHASAAIRASSGALRAGAPENRGSIVPPVAFEPRLPGAIEVDFGNNCSGDTYSRYYEEMIWQFQKLVPRNSYLPPRSPLRRCCALARPRHPVGAGQVLATTVTPGGAEVGGPTKSNPENVLRPLTL